jgi:lipopolysaccharide biosynthesis glycosyltransferase
MEESKKLVLTMAHGYDYLEIAKITHPFIKDYALKCEADFLCIDKQKISKSSMHWEKFQIYDLLNTYDRILWLDTDLLIREDTPDLFKEVPYDSFGIFNEKHYLADQLMKDIFKKHDMSVPEDWDGSYYNTGVMILSKQHKFIFEQPVFECNSRFYEQCYLNMIIAKAGRNLKIYPLSPALNCILYRDHRKSFIMHYAGIHRDTVIPHMKPDLEFWKSLNLKGV